MKDDHRQETIDELKAALAELESGDGLERFVEGHGIQSRFFAFAWSEPALRIDFRLPCARVLSDEETQAEDAAAAGAAIRMAILLLVASAGDKLLADDEASLSVTADEGGWNYETRSPDGEIVDSGDDWEPLVARLKTRLADDADAPVSIIWP